MMPDIAELAKKLTKSEAALRACNQQLARSQIEVQDLAGELELRNQEIAELQQTVDAMAKQINDLTAAKST